MTISQTDLVIYQSERLTDFADGGGRMTGNEVVDGQVNNLFPDISQADQVAGRVNLRKAFPAVMSANTDVLLGTHVLLTQPPANPFVHATLFSTGSHADLRADAQNRVESYLVRGPRTRFLVYGDQLAGQRAIRLVCSLEQLTPEVGETFVLSIEAKDRPAKLQYVRISRFVKRSTETFRDESGDPYKADVIFLEISTPLAEDFPGEDPTKALLPHGPSFLRQTQVADAARYYSVKPLTQPAALGAMQLKIDHPYVPLVPSTQAESPLLDLLAGEARRIVIQSGQAGLMQSSALLAGRVAPDFSATLSTPQAIAGPAVITVGAVSLVDRGNGVLSAPAGNTEGWGGHIDYAAGRVTVTRSSAWSEPVTVTAAPGAVVTDKSASYALAIKAGNRQYNYVYTATPAPAPGSVTLDYRALNKWYRLTDNGRGQLVGQPGQGSGSVDYVTGTLMVTLGALPDAGSKLIFTWGTPTVQVRRDGGSRRLAVIRKLDKGSCSKGSLSVSWQLAGVAKTATDAAGQLVGDATGTVDYATGEVVLEPNDLPAPGTEFKFSYREGAGGDGLSNETLPVTAGDILNFKTANGGLKPGTVSCRLTIAHANKMELYQVSDDGQGGWVGVEGGIVNYDTGAITLPLPLRQWWTALGWGSWTQSGRATVPNGGTVHVRYALAAKPDANATETVTLDRVELRLSAAHEPLVAGSLLLRNGTTLLFDRDGKLLTDHQPTTGSGRVVGSVSYSARTVTLTDYPAGLPNRFEILGALAVRGTYAITALSFRTPGAPIAINSLNLRATRLDTGATLSVVADGNGKLLADGVEGEVDVLTGVVDVRFGARVTAAGHEKEPWYRAEDVDGAGKIWRPYVMSPESVRFNAVALANLPLDAGILGLDPVRLPQDGRVPAYRPGDMVVVHHTATTTLPNPVTAGQQLSLRPRLSWAKVQDANGTLLPSSKYQLDLDTGQLTLAAPLDLAGFAQPLRVEHRIEDMALLSDVQISGELTLTRPLSHAFPAGAYVSSVLMVGDLQGRASRPFSQQTWNKVWADSLLGDSTSAQYDSVRYPPRVSNDGAITERWALIFTSASAFNLIGETVGQIGSGDISKDFAPTNPVSGKPYFVLRAGGFGTGWAAGNVIRLNTIGAQTPVWLARTILAGQATQQDDSFTLEIRGDAN